MPKGKVTLTVDDIIATLKNSSLPSVIVEGEDDLVILRRIEEKFSEEFVSVLPVGGRHQVIELFERQMEFNSRKKVAFVADQDSFVFCGIPNKLADPTMIFTEGYSIENDALRDINVQSLMTPAERTSFAEELEITIKWFALAISNFLHGRPEPLDIHPNHLLNQHDLDAQLSEMLHYDKDASDRLEQIQNNPMKMLRGKFLLSLAIRQLSAPSRPVRHQPRPILDLAGANPGVLLNSLFSRIKAALQI